MNLAPQSAGWPVPESPETSPSPASIDMPPADAALEVAPAAAVEERAEPDAATSPGVADEHAEPDAATSPGVADEHAEPLGANEHVAVAVEDERAVPDAAAITAIDEQGALNAGLLRLSNLMGAGLVRVDGDGLAWPLNESAGGLLEVLGGGEGEPAPTAIVTALDTSTSTGVPHTEEVLTLPPSSRHITIAALQSDRLGLVALREHTEERLLQ